MSNKYASMLGRATKVEEDELEGEKTKRISVQGAEQSAKNTDDDPLVGTFVRMPFSLKRELQGLLPPGKTMQDIIIAQVRLWVKEQRS